MKIRIITTPIFLLQWRLALCVGSGPVVLALALSACVVADADSRLLNRHVVHRYGEKMRDMTKVQEKRVLASVVKALSHPYHVLRTEARPAGPMRETI